MSRKLRVVAVLAAAFLFTSVSGAFASTFLFTRSSTTSQQSDIYASTDGVLTNLTQSDALNSYPSWSHDHRRIAFVSNHTGVNQIYAMNTDGSGVTNISADGVAASYPSWSADDTQISYIHAGDVYRMGTDGSGETRIASGFPYVFQTAWSPDGSRIAFTVYESGHYHLYTVKPDGSSVTNLTTSANPDMESPAWSPDGSQLAFDADVSNGRNADVYVMDADGSNIRDITPSEGDDNRPDVSPSWSADGQSILFASTRANPVNVYRIFAMPVADGGPAQLTFDDANGGSFIDQTPVTLPLQKTQPQSEAAPEAEGSSAGSDGDTPPASIKEAPEPLRYVALGDSVAAGEGINYQWTWKLDSKGRDGSWHFGNPNPRWEGATNRQLCHQSNRSYPYLLGLYANVKLVSSLACTGASGSNGVLCSQWFGAAEVPAQLGSTSSSLYLCNGGIGGGDVYDAARADVVTLQVGADDIHFGEFLYQCYKPRLNDCGSTKDTKAVDNLLLKERLNLSRIFREIIRRAAQVGKVPPKVYVVDYYDPFPSVYRACHDLAPLSGFLMSPTEMSWVKKQLAKLNQNILAGASAFNNAVAVDVAKLLHPVGVTPAHTFCTKDPWVYGARIRVDYGGNPSSFHPAPPGQVAIAKAIAKQIK